MSEKENDKSGSATPVPIDPKMLGVLVCPKTRGPLTHDSETQELISSKAGLAYPIRDGVPILLIEEARAL
ncbi:MAG: Trm112 family protein [Pseudomonadota bacterium]